MSSGSRDGPHLTPRPGEHIVAANTAMKTMRPWGPIPADITVTSSAGAHWGEALRRGWDANSLGLRLGSQQETLSLWMGREEFWGKPQFLIFFWLPFGPRLLL